MSAAHTPSTLDAPSYSRLAKLHDCRRAYYWRYVRRATPRGSGIYSAAGRAIHAALDVLMRRPDAWDSADDAIAIHMAGVERDDKTAYLTSKHLGDIVRGHRARWQGDGWAPVLLDGQQLGERSMAVPLTPSLSMTIVIDALVALPDGRIVVVDRKATTAYLGRGVQQRQAFTHQMPLYVAAARQLVGQCDGAIVDAIYMGEHACKPASTATKFDRYEFDYTDGQLEEAVAWAEASAERARAEEGAAGAQAEAQWLQAPGASCAFCDYRQLCEITPALRERRIEGAYNVEDV